MRKAGTPAERPVRLGPEGARSPAREARERGQTEAVVAVRLAWAVPEARDAERLSRALTGCLEPGQAMGVVLERGPGERLHAGLELTAQGRRWSEAGARARLLEERVRSTLGVFGPMVGVVPGARPPGPPGGWTCRVEPARVIVSAGPVREAGFSQPTKAGGRQALALPVPVPGREPVEALVEALDRLAGMRARAVLRVWKDWVPGLAPGLLDRILGGLLEGCRLVWDGVPWDPTGPLGGPVVEELAARVDVWRRSGPLGWRLECVLEADRALPPGLLDLACAVVFGAPRCRCGSMSSRGVADLSGWLPGGAPPPTLMPSAEALVRAGTPRMYPVPPLAGAKGEGVVVGEVQVPGSRRPVHLPARDRSRHVYVVGATGTGKSTLLYNMIVQDMEAGRGVGLIDPHGDLFLRVLRAVPPGRAAEVTIVDPTDFGHVPGVNLLEVSGPRPDIQKGFVVNEMIRIFDRLYDLRTTGGPIFEQYMRNALLLALNARDHRATLMDVCRVFESSAYRHRLMERCTDPEVTRFWRDQAEATGGDAALHNLTPYVTSKLNQFTHNPLLRPIVGQARSTVDFRGLMDRGNILLVNLPKGILGDLDARLLGMILMGKIFQAGLARASRPEGRRRPFHLFVDEFQNFSTETASHMLSEARKFGLCLVLANQSLQQIGQYAAPGQALAGAGGVLPAVLGNAGNLVVFRTGPLDAPHLAPFVGPTVGGQDLQHLPDFHAVVRLLANGTPLPPFVVRTRPPASPSDAVACARAIRRLSRRRYTRPRAEVEAELREFAATG